MLRANEPGRGLADMNEPRWFGSSNSNPPVSSWKSKVKV